MNKNKNIIRLTESQLKQMIAESVKDTLNELSSDLLYRAGDLARLAGRSGQSERFKTYGNEQLSNEVGNNTDNISVKRDFIAYQPIQSVTDYIVEIPKNGQYNTSRGKDGNLLNLHYVPQILRTDSPRVARILSKWAAKTWPEYTEFHDWHSWVL